MNKKEVSLVGIIAIILIIISLSIFTTSPKRSFSNSEIVQNHDYVEVDFDDLNVPSSAENLKLDFDEISAASHGKVISSISVCILQENEYYKSKMNDFDPFTVLIGRRYKGENIYDPSPIPTDKNEIESGFYLEIENPLDSGRFHIDRKIRLIYSGSIKYKIRARGIIHLQILAEQNPFFSGLMDFFTILGAISLLTGIIFLIIRVLKS